MRTVIAGTQPKLCPNCHNVNWNREGELHAGGRPRKAIRTAPAFAVAEPAPDWPDSEQPTAPEAQKHERGVTPNPKAKQ